MYFRSCSLALLVPCLLFACSPAGSADDAGPDAGDAATDGGEPTDAGAVDAGGTDAGETDAGSSDRCRSASECGPYDVGAADCAVPDPLSFPASPCGACLPEEDECTTDDDCGAGFVCRPEGPCGCGAATLVCVDGCTSNADCLTGQTCDGDSHCVATSCTSPSDCPSQFACDGDGACARLTCTVDGDCDAGFCVEGLCFDELGTCFENVAAP